MSVEQFMGFDASEGMSQASLEQLKAKMAAASAQIAAIKKEEGKQKKQEDELLKILLAFVKTSHKQELILLISRALEQNLPANFLLAIIILGNEEIKQAVGKFLMLGGGAGSGDPDASDSAVRDGDRKNSSLIFFREDETLPLKVKIELDNWMKTILFQAEENPQKLLRTAYQLEPLELPKESAFEETKYDFATFIRPQLIDLMSHVLSVYLKSHALPADPAETSKFTEFILEGILTKTRENFESRQMLGGQVSEPF